MKNYSSREEHQIISKDSHGYHLDPLDFPLSNISKYEENSHEKSRTLFLPSYIHI